MIKERMKWFVFMVGKIFIYIELMIDYMKEKKKKKLSGIVWKF